MQKNWTSRKKITKLRRTIAGDVGYEKRPNVAPVLGLNQPASLGFMPTQQQGQGEVSFPNTTKPLGTGIGIRPPANKTTNMLDFWKRPVVGKMPLDQFSAITGGLAHAIAPETPQGRIGKMFGEQGQQMYNLRMGRGLEAQDEAADRERKLDELKEQRVYDKGLSTEQWERGGPGRALNRDFREAQIRKMDRPQTFRPLRPSESERHINRYMEETGASFEDASEWYARRGQGEIADTGKSAFQNVHSLLTSIGTVDMDDGSYVIPVGKSGGLSPEAINALEESGITYNLSASKVIDDGGFFGAAQYGKKLTLGNYDPEKAKRYRLGKQYALENGFEQVVNTKGKMQWINREAGQTLNIKTGKITQKKLKQVGTGKSTVSKLLSSKAKAPKAKGLQKLSKLREKALSGIESGAESVFKHGKKALRLGE